MIVTEFAILPPRTFPPLKRITHVCLLAIQFGPVGKPFRACLPARLAPLGQRITSHPSILFVLLLFFRGEDELLGAAYADKLFAAACGCIGQCCIVECSPSCRFGSA